MDDFCGSKFWDLNITWNTNDPDFTTCFEDTVLIWIPTAFIGLFCWFDISSALRLKGKPLPTSVLYIVHNVVMILLIVAQVADFAYTFKSGGPEIFPSDRAAPACRVISYILAAITHGINKRKGIPSSGTLFMFWFAAAVCGVFEFQTWIRSLPLGDDSYAKFWFGTSVVTYALTVVECGLHCFSDNASIQKTAGAQADESNDEITTRSSRKLPKLEPCPAPWASFPSKITYQWFWAVAWKGYRKPLEYDELWDLNTTEKSRTVLQLFYEYWRPALEDVQRWNSQNEIKVTPIPKSQEKQGKEAPEPKSNRKTASVLPAVWRTVWSTFLFGALLKVVQDLLTFVSPQLLNVLIRHVQSDEEEWKGYFYAALLFLAVMIQTFFLSSYFYYMFMVGMRVRSALIGAIYDKSLVISNAARRAFTVGEIVNLMSVDAQRFVDITTYVNMIWSAPLQITLSVYFLYNTLGPAVFAGVGVLLLLIPVSGFMASKMKALQFAQLQQKDKRVKLMNEVLSGIKVLKLYAWELSFQGQVNAIREREIQLLRRAAIWQALSTFVYYTTPFLVSLVTLGTYVLIDDQNVLDANKAFVSLTLFNVMRMPMTMLPMIIVFMIEANVSLKRINRFMNADEIDKTAISHVKDGENVITVKNGNFSWGETPVLNDINFDIKKGSLTAIVGTVGSGKSSLLSAILGEMEKMNGQVNRLGSVAYVAQQAWIQNATLRENILFEKDYNEKMYKKVIKDCALEPDLKILTAGDRTEIGEKGINLSGGQKQRVSLARAVYNNADLYLLDDPLSAVDSHVGKHLFDKVIGPKGILKHKTRLIVTHGITYLPHVDNILVMKDGQIAETGTFQQLLDQKGSFAEFLELHATQEDLENVDEETAEKIQQVMNRSNSIISTGAQDRRNSSWSLRSRASVRSKSSVESNTDQESTTTETGEKLIEIEKAETGSVKSDVYWYYLRFLGHGYVVLSLVFNVAIQLFMALSNVWLSQWSNEEPNEDGTQDAATRNKYLGIYGAFGVGQAVSIVIASIAMSYGTLRAGKLMQSRMLARVMRSPMSFFDTTPLGRIVNRFAKDVDVADATFPQNLKSWLNCLFQVISTLVIISVSTPWFLVVIIPIAIIYYATQRFYVATSRQLKRIESITRSPIYSHFSETLTGAVTIRAFGMGRTFAVDSALKVDVNQIAYFPSIIANRWLAIRLETVGNFIIFFAALFAVLSNNDKGSLGLSVSYALSITQTLNWLVRMTSDVETNVVAIERIKEYTEVPQEADWKNETKQPPKEWPHAGNIEFVQYQTRYREGLDLVLKDVTCKINSGEKVGIVGRTGAGKSSLTVGLFRLIEAAGGKIVIDDVDISEIGLHDVRGKLTIIPQDPVLFSGTLRINLDPFGDKSDSELWNALEYAHLKEFVKTLPEGLEYNIAEGGENLSVGQRQLVCLARALLRKTKVLILDEATAAVDLDTDDLIQKTIRSEFKDCTVLTIAHRLNTIMDYNRVMVLDKGIIKEFDSPDVLLKDNQSIFYGMAKDANLV